MSTHIDKAVISIEDSSFITLLEWERKRNPLIGNLTIKFSNGNIYEYIDVPSRTLFDMVSSNSVGTYFHKNIKDKYTTYKHLEK